MQIWHKIWSLSSSSESPLLTVSLACSFSTESCESHTHAALCPRGFPCGFLYWHVLSLSSPPGKNPDKIKHSEKIIDYPYFLLMHHCIFTVLTKKWITFFLPYLFMNCKSTENVSYLCPCPQALSWHCACSQPGLCAEWVNVCMMKYRLKTQALV